MKLSGMRSASSAQSAGTLANRFRPIIEAAAAAGDLSHQVLHLTFGDNAKLRRDASVQDDEISFSSGAMMFLGVRVVAGAPMSRLADANGLIVALSPQEMGLSAMAKGQKKSNKEVRKPKAEKPKPPVAARDFTKPPSTPR